MDYPSDGIVSPDTVAAIPMLVTLASAGSATPNAGRNFVMSANARPFVMPQSGHHVVAAVASGGSRQSPHHSGAPSAGGSATQVTGSAPHLSGSSSVTVGSENGASVTLFAAAAVPAATDETISPGTKASVSADSRTDMAVAAPPDPTLLYVVAPCTETASAPALGLVLSAPVIEAVTTATTMSTQAVAAATHGTAAQSDTQSSADTSMEEVAAAGQKMLDPQQVDMQGSVDALTETDKPAPGSGRSAAAAEIDPEVQQCVDLRLEDTFSVDPDNAQATGLGPTQDEDAQATDQTDAPLLRKNASMDVDEPAAGPGFGSKASSKFQDLDVSISDAAAEEAAPHSSMPLDPVANGSGPNSTAAGLPRFTKPSPLDLSVLSTDAAGAFASPLSVSIARGSLSARELSLSGFGTLTDCTTPGVDTAESAFRTAGTRAVGSGGSSSFGGFVARTTISGNSPGGCIILPVGVWGS